MYDRNFKFSCRFNEQTNERINERTVEIYLLNAIAANIFQCFWKGLNSKNMIIPCQSLKETCLKWAWLKVLLATDGEIER